MENYVINDDSNWCLRKPKNQIYISCDFETKGTCPRCDANVVCSIGFKNIRCPNCNLLLNWD